jgi:hypothetical protein
VERALVLLCLGVFAGRASALAAWATLADWLDLVKSSACLALGCAMIGIWLTNQIEDVPTRSFGGSWAKWLARLQDWLMPSGGVLCRLERAGVNRDTLAQAVEAMAGSDQDLRRAIDVSSAGIMTASGAIDQVADGTLAVAGGIRATTAKLAAMGQAASGILDAVQDSRRALVALSSRTAPLADLADRLHQELQSVERQVASLPPCEPDVAPAVQAIKTVAASAMVILDTMLSEVAELASATEGSAAQVERMTVMVLDQHRAGEALSASILAQGNEVTAVLRQIDAARPALMAAQASGEKAGAIEAARYQAARIVWQEAATVPGRAETIALLLRNLPGFSSVSASRP